MLVTRVDVQSSGSRCASMEYCLPNDKGALVFFIFSKLIFTCEFVIYVCLWFSCVICDIYIYINTYTYTCVCVCACAHVHALKGLGENLLNLPRSKSDNAHKNWDVWKNTTLFPNKSHHLSVASLYICSIFLLLSINWLSYFWFLWCPQKISVSLLLCHKMDLTLLY